MLENSDHIVPDGSAYTLVQYGGGVYRIQSATGDGAQEAEQQRLNLAEAKIEQTKNDDIRKIRANTNNQLSALESFIRLWAVWLPALPALKWSVPFWRQDNREIA